MKSTRHSVVILGAGPAGLTAGHQLLHEYGIDDFIIVEKSKFIGGLCRSIEFGGGVFDIGGHSFHTPWPDVKDFVEDVTGGLFHQRRNATVWYGGKTFPYPFQQNYKSTEDEALIAECEKAESKGVGEKPEKFGDFLTWKFGKGIADAFMTPYNRKIWGMNLNRMSTEWTSERIADTKTDTFKTDGGKRTALQPDTEVGYPTKGGFGEIFSAISSHIPESHFKMRTTYELIHPDARRMNTLTDTMDGKYERQRVEYDFIINTTPLDKFMLNIIDGIVYLHGAVSKLEKLSLLLDLIAAPLEREAPQRIYISDPTIPAHKIAFNHYSSDTLRERPVHGIMCESSFSPHKKKYDDWSKKNIEFLVSEGYIDLKKVKHLPMIVEYAYPIYTRERLGYISKAMQYLIARNIYSIGRFGQYQYWNSDQVMKQAMATAKAVATRLKGK